MLSLPLIELSILAGVALSTPTKVDTAKRATCTVDSVSSADDLSDCSAVVIEAFTVADGGTYTLFFLFSMLPRC